MVSRIVRARPNQSPDTEFLRRQLETDKTNAVSPGIQFVIEGDQEVIYDQVGNATYLITASADRAVAFPSAKDVLGRERRIIRTAGAGVITVTSEDGNFDGAGSVSLSAATATWFSDGRNYWSV